MVDGEGTTARQTPCEQAGEVRGTCEATADTPPTGRVALVRASDDWAATLTEVRRAAASGRPVVLLSTALDPGRALEALRAGAGCMLPADMAPPLLAAALRELESGGRVTPPPVPNAIVVRWGEQTPPAPEPGPNLSPREREVLGLVSRGLTTPEVARVLGLSTGTVRTHLEHLFRKLDVTRRTEAVREALRLGLLPP